jgi:hypothetical protein
MNKLTFFVAILIATMTTKAQENNVFNYFLKGETGTKSTVYVYTGSGAKIGQQTFEIIDIKTDCDTPYVIYQSKTTGMGRSVILKYKVTFYNNTSYVELKDYLNVANFVKSGVVEIEPEFLPFPAEMPENDTLIGYTMTRHYGSHDIVTKMVNRKTEGFETISCPAGDFKCIKISYTIEGITPNGTFVTSYTDWINKDVGIVKQESKTGSGRVENYFILQKINKITTQ